MNCLCICYICSCNSKNIPWTETFLFAFNQDIICIFGRLHLDRQSSASVTVFSAFNKRMLAESGPEDTLSHITWDLGVGWLQSWLILWIYDTIETRSFLVISLLASVCWLVSLMVPKWFQIAGYSSCLHIPISRGRKRDNFSVVPAFPGTELGDRPQHSDLAHWGGITENQGFANEEEG